MKALLEFLLATSFEPEPLGSVEQWWQRHRSVTKRFSRHADCAVAAGFSMDRLGYAFASGYQCAGRALFGTAGDEIGALCATEAGGVHPRAIHCRLRKDGSGYLLEGRKSFVTLGGYATRLLIVATVGEDAEGRNRLRIVGIESEREGVGFEPIPPAPFVPEIPHASLVLRAVSVQERDLLVGDGYDAYLKPFRTVEDCYVHAALLGYLIQVSRRARWPSNLLEELVAAMIAMHSLAAQDPSSPEVHLALAGAIGVTRKLVNRTADLWGSVDGETAQRWQRDKGLLDVAAKARVKRLEAARARLWGGR